MINNSIKFLTLIISALIIDVSNQQTSSSHTFIANTNPQSLSFTFPYSSSFFTAQPLAITTIFSMETNSNLMYWITTNITYGNITIQIVGSTGWISVGVSLWLSARQDLYIGQIQFGNIETSKQVSVSGKVERTVGFAEDQRTKYLHFINSIRATSQTGTVSINTSFISFSENSINILVQTDQQTTISSIKISFIIYNLELSQFSSTGGILQMQLSTDNSNMNPNNTQRNRVRYLPTHQTFSSIGYSFLGFNSISGHNFDFSLSIDTDQILSFYFAPASGFVGVIYLNIAVRISQSCKNCTFKFENLGLCLQQCPLEKYAFQYEDEGKGCLNCSKKLGLKLKQDRSGCECQTTGMSNIGGICIASLNTANNGSVVTNPVTTLPNIGIGQIDLTPTTPNLNMTLPQEQTSTAITIPPITHSTSDTDTLTPQQIIPPAVTCRNNETVVSGVCVCDQFSIVVDNGCFKCVQGSFKSGDVCSPCLMFCLVCTSSFTCSKCQQGYTFNQFQIMCVETSIVSPICNKNQILNQTTNTCICDNFSISISLTQCLSCMSGTYKDGSSCSLCIQLCINCTSLNNCYQCIQRYQFNNITKTCNFIGNAQTNTTNNSTNSTPIVCPTDQLFQAQTNRCVCNSKSVLYNNQCIQCPLPTFKDPLLQICQSCAINDENCASCENLQKCLSCYNNLQVGNSGKCECLPPYYQLDLGCMMCPIGFTFSQIQKTCIISTTNNTNNQCSQNQIYNGTICICNQLSTNTSGTCQPCPSSYFKNNQSCVQCTQNCLNCSSLTNCFICQDRHSFNSQTLKCQPFCLTNQLVQNNTCVCDTTSIQTSQGCQRCPDQTVKSENICVNCPLNCLQCITSAICTQCLNGFQLNLATSKCCLQNQVYNSTQQRCVCATGFVLIDSKCGVCGPGEKYVDGLGTCVTEGTGNGTCGLNQITINGKCTCINNTIRTTTQCQPCPSSTFANTFTCTPCVANCLSCTNSQICLQCSQNYTGPSCQLCSNGYYIVAGVTPPTCQQDRCGNGAILGKEQCDDGNVIGGDGCSAACEIQNGYVCRSVGCTKLLEKEKERITSIGVISRFRYLYPETFNSSSITNVRIVSGPEPQNIRIQKSESDSSSLRILLDYCGLLPLEKIILQLSSNSQIGDIKYVSEYNLGDRTIIPRTVATYSLKEPEEILS